MDDWDSKTVDVFVRGTEFARYLLKPRVARPKPANVNPKATTADFVPLAVLGDKLAREIGAKSKVLRLTEPVAEKMWWKHGPGVKRERDRKRLNVPPKWYADIPQILRETTPYKNERDRWQFDHARMKRTLVIDLDERKNPVMITYHGKKTLK